jgi:soluble lytic murein transglycosylase-like protein
LIANGWTPQELQSFDPTDQNVDALSSAAMTVNEVISGQTLKWNPIGENGSFATDQFGNPVGAGNPFAPQTPQPQPNNDAVFGALIQQESGGQAGIKGPKTVYGVPLGKTQMLPGTAQEMASKLGLPWRPDLLTAKTPEAAAYQEKLGRAYFDEGLQKYGGDAEKALMYYHGGPDESLWGPKTRTYAKSVLARVKSKADPASVRQKARAAIAAGADPEAVRERAAALGVTL